MNNTFRLTSKSLLQKNICAAGEGGSLDDPLSSLDCSYNVYKFDGEISALRHSANGGTDFSRQNDEGDLFSYKAGE